LFADCKATAVTLMRKIYFQELSRIWSTLCVCIEDANAMLLGQSLQGKREDYQNCSVLCCVLKLCTVISTHRWAVLTVLWIGFCHTGPISLCLDLFLLICVYFACFCFILHRCCITV